MLHTWKSYLHTLRCTDPLRISISPSKADINEDLPAPTWPTTANNFPSSTLKFILQKQINDHLIILNFSTCLQHIKLEDIKNMVNYASFIKNWNHSRFIFQAYFKLSSFALTTAQLCQDGISAHNQKLCLQINA